MNILILTQYFYPENFRINDFAKEFKRRGHDITVLTSVPNYPKGKFYKGYGIFKKNREIYEGIKIYRAPVIPRGNGSNIRLSLNYISYVFGATFRSFFLLNKKIDIIFVFEPSPITVCLPAIFLKKIKKIPICFWVLDLWPEIISSVTNINEKLVNTIFNPIVKYIYRNSDKILVSSEGFINSIHKKGISKSKIVFYPQWAEAFFKPINIRKNLLNNVPKNSFKIMFAGNIGESQDFPSILEAAKLLKDKLNIHWVILGDGRKKKWVELKIKEYDINHCFHLLGSFPIEKMPEFYSQADCMLFSLKKEYIFSITIPAKVQSYLACKKPIIAMIDGEAAKIINNAKCGLTCPSGEYKNLADNILQLSSMSQKELIELGDNSIKFYKKTFEREMLMNKAEKIFEKMIKKC